MFYLRSRGAHLVLASEVTRSLQFSWRLVEIAYSMIHVMTAGGRNVFNGLHITSNMITQHHLGTKVKKKVRYCFESIIPTPGTAEN